MVNGFGDILLSSIPGLGSTYIIRGIKTNNNWTRQYITIHGKQSENNMLGRMNVLRSKYPKRYPDEQNPEERRRVERLKSRDRRNRD